MNESLFLSEARGQEQAKGEKNDEMSQLRQQNVGGD